MAHSQHNGLGFPWVVVPAAVSLFTTIFGATQSKKQAQQQSQLIQQQQQVANTEQAAQLQQMQLLMEYQKQQQQLQAQQDAAKEKRFIKYGSLAAAFLILTYMMKDNK